MTIPQITIYDAKTGETVIRDFNAAELAQLELDKTQATKDEKTKAKALEEKESQRKRVLTKLGISIEEAQALLG